MERGAEPWSWVLETSSAGSHDFCPGVGLRREGPPCPTRILLPAQGESQASLWSETGERPMREFRSGF